MIKNDKRKGIKPSKELSKEITKLLKGYTVRELQVMLDTNFVTLKKVERRENVMPYKIAELENKIKNLKTA